MDRKYNGFPDLGNRQNCRLMLACHPQHFPTQPPVGRRVRLHFSALHAAAGFKGDMFGAESEFENARAFVGPVIGREIERVLRRIDRIAVANDARGRFGRGGGVVGIDQDDAGDVALVDPGIGAALGNVRGKAGRTYKPKSP